MLTQHEGGAAGQISTAPANEPERANESAVSAPIRSRWSRALRVEWLGQTIASLCWIVSMFFYGVTSVGDGLQLTAASAWLVANIASLAEAESSSESPPQKR
ncbi:MAG: hypothetical protein AAF517_15820 [Planctomycetota bacterium]